MAKMTGTEVTVAEQAELLEEVEIPAEEMGTQVSGLVKLALEKGVAIEVLERLVALQERVTERDARTQFFDALAAFQEECPEIHKSASAEIVTKGGGKYGYKYAPLDKTLRIVGPPLRKHGLSTGWTTGEGSKPDILLVQCVLRHTAGHQEVASFPVPTATDASMSGAQKAGAALTYGQRMSLVSVLGLTVSEDIDGAAAVETITPDQISELNHMISGSGANFQKWLVYMGVASMDQITKADFAKAKSSLQQRAGQDL